MIGKFSNPAGSKVLHPSLAAFIKLCPGAMFSPVYVFSVIAIIEVVPCCGLS